MPVLERLASCLQRLGFLPRHHREDPRLKRYDRAMACRRAGLYSADEPCRFRIRPY